MKCPHCKLFNPDSALRCDCGYEFGSGAVKQSYLRAYEGQKAASRFQQLVERHGGVEAAFRALGRWRMLQGAAWCSLAATGTLITYIKAVDDARQTGAGTYVVFTGLFAIGIAQFSRGLVQFLRKHD